MDAMEQIKAINQKTIHVVEAAGQLLVSENPAELPEQGRLTPVSAFVIRRVNVKDITELTLQTVMGTEPLMQVAAASAAEAAIEMAKVDTVPSRPPYDLPADPTELKMFEAALVAKFEVVRRGLVSPDYETLSAETDFYHDMLYQCIVHFSQPGATFPKVTPFAKPTPSVG